MDNINGILTTIGLILGYIVTISTLWVTIVSNKRTPKSVAQEVVDIGIKDYKDDADMLLFLERCKKQQLIEQILGVLIRPCEVKPTLAFLADGRIRYGELRMIWRFRKIDKNNNLSFELSRGEQIKKWLFAAGAFSSVVFGTVTFFYAMLSTASDAKEWLIVAFLMIGAVLFFGLGNVPRESVGAIMKRKSKGSLAISEPMQMSGSSTANSG